MAAVEVRGGVTNAPKAQRWETSRKPHKKTARPKYVAGRRDRSLQPDRGSDKSPRTHVVTQTSR